MLTQLAASDNRTSRHAFLAGLVVEVSFGNPEYKQLIVTSTCGFEFAHLQTGQRMCDVE